MKETSHLSPLGGATLLAWIADEDIQAVRVGSEERLYVDGRYIPLTSDHHHPSQQVINYAHQVSNAAKRRMRSFWDRLGRA